MTFILSIANSRQLIQFSDRRLSANGSVVDEHSNKSTAFICANGRFAVGYTGLARTGTFALQPWLVDALSKCAKPDYGIYETAGRLTDALTSLFRTDRRIASLAPPHRKLTVMLSGYVYNSRPGKVGNLLITNFQDFASGKDHSGAQDSFTLTSELEIDNPVGRPLTFVQRVGAWPAMTARDESVLRSLLSSDAPVEVLIDAGVGIIRDIASRSTSQGTVGREIHATVIPRNLEATVSTVLRHPGAQDTLVFTDQVTAVPEFQFAVRDVQIRVENSTGTEGFRPRLGRNERCWCGSGSKYKRCHGR